MQATKRKQNQSQEVQLRVEKYLGRNSWGNHGALSMNESRELSNWDIFAGDGDDYLKSRRGSAVLQKASSPTKYGSTNITNGVTWDIGSEEYLITQIGTSFYSQALLTTGDPVLIAHLDTGTFTVSSTAQADMFLTSDKLYIFHAGGNKIIEWFSGSSVFKGRSMGRAAPVISSVAVATAGAITGSYAVGVELVYQDSGVDRDASTPNRKLSTGIIAVTGTIAAKKITVALSSTVIDADTTWTHLRFWRSKNKNSDLTDPANPIDPQGNNDELYEEALITKAELNAGALASVATTAGLPPGNAGTEAGKPAGVYTVRVNNADSVLFNLLELDSIELVPLPKANIGCFVGNRIFVSRVEDTTLDDRSKNNIYYSNFGGTKYGELYNPLNFISTGRDGQQMMKLLAMEKDLIGIKEAKTGRLAGGNVDLEFETLDFRIGITDKNAASYIPSVGICAITNDYGDFRIFGYDLKWAKEIHGVDISTPIRVESSAMTAANVSFIYINGKLILSDGTGVMYALHEKNKRGWTKYSYPMHSLAQRVFTFANGSRAAVVTKSTYLVELEKSSGDVDYSTVDDSASNDIDLSETTCKFKSDDARDILEMDALSIEGSLSDVLSGAPYTNGKPWPDQTTAAYTDFAPNPSIYSSDGYLIEREYKLYIEPQTVGDYEWIPVIGNTIYFILTTTAPATIRSKVLKAVVDQDGMAGGDFDPFQSITGENKFPDWSIIGWPYTQTQCPIGYTYDRDSAAGPGLDSSWTSDQLSASDAIVQSDDHYERKSTGDDNSTTKYKIYKTLAAIPSSVEMYITASMDYLTSGFSIATTAVPFAVIGIPTSNYLIGLYFRSTNTNPVENDVYLRVYNGTTYEYTELLYSDTSVAYPPYVFSLSYAATLRVDFIAGNNISVYIDGVLKFTSVSGLFASTAAVRIWLARFVGTGQDINFQVKNIAYLAASGLPHECPRIA